MCHVSLVSILTGTFTREEHTGSQGAHRILGISKETGKSPRGALKCDTDMKEYLMECIERQISREPDIYFEDYRERISQYFREENFYCEPSGVDILPTV